MNVTSLTALLPLLVVSATTVLLLVEIMVRRNHALTVSITLVGLFAAFLSLWLVKPVVPHQVSGLLLIDAYGVFYIGLILAATFVVTILSYNYFKHRSDRPEELYVLLLIASLGSMVLVSSTHFVSFFLGLEILSISLYVLAAYMRTESRSLEAGIKYLIPAASSSAFLLFGMALVYAQLGTMSLTGLSSFLPIQGNQPLVIAGLALIVVGIGFKLAVVPFHLWTPDVYEGAPAPVTAFIATVSKASVFALLLRYFASDSPQLLSMFTVFSILAIASMFGGNLLALRQNNIKRVLAYSSIAHMGYLLVPFLAGGRMASEAVGFYFLAYILTTLGAFGIVTVLSGKERDADDLEDYRGLFWRRPILAGMFTLFLFSLAGIPLTAGFLAKFYIVAAGASSAGWALILLLVTSSVIGLFYYLRIVVALYSNVPATERGSQASLPSISPLSGYVLESLAILLVWIGVYPGPFFSLIRMASLR